LKVGPEVYARAERLLPGHAERLIRGGNADGVFDVDSDRFRFVTQRDGDEVGLTLDPAAGSLDDLAADEADEVKAAVQARELALSPNGQTAVVTREGNLFLRDVASGSERQVTDDGSRDRPYAARLDWYRVQREIAGVPNPPVVTWSPDSSCFVTERLDQSRVREVQLIQCRDDEFGPVLWSYRDALPGDERVVESQLFLVEVDTARATEVQLEPLEISMIQPVLFRQVWFSPDSSRAEAVLQSRDQRDAKLLELSRKDGSVRIAAEDRRPTVIDPGLLMWEERGPAARVLDDGRGLWLSERDGWAHLWIVEDGSWTQLTKGEWVVRELLRVDETDRTVLFTASGRESDDDPWGRKLYRISLDGGDPQLLTPEPVDHFVQVSPSGQWFIDNASGPQVPPVATLRESSGGTVKQELSRADISGLRHAGWRPPERFTVTAADGETELHGLLYLPPDFDENSQWPILDTAYPGPQVGVVSPRFGLNEFFQLDAFAALGVVVMALEARGTPLRSKQFHDALYGALDYCPAIDDHAAAVRQLAQRHKWLDPTRVGIVGSSAGGHMAVRALIEHPETFSTAISSVGSHDNRRIHANWGERWLGVMEQDPVGWERQSNVTRAHRLRGNLLLGVAELDSNVNPIVSRALIRELVRADIDHEVVLVPEGDHQMPLVNPYFVRKAWDFVIRHLVGAEPPRYSIDAASLHYPQLI
jgi:dipeptidyl aminopeptidase/acylaminoacyl peptidase